MRLPRMTTRWWMIAVAAIVLSVAWLVLPYRVSRYRGDGAITDGGFWSYPRYRIRLPQAELTANRTRLYKLKGLPPSASHPGIGGHRPSSRRSQGLRSAPGDELPRCRSGSLTSTAG